MDLTRESFYSELYMLAKTQAEGTKSLLDFLVPVFLRHKHQNVKPSGLQAESQSTAFFEPIAKGQPI